MNKEHEKWKCRGGSRDFEKGAGALCLPPWLADEEYFTFQMV